MESYNLIMDPNSKEPNLDSGILKKEKREKDTSLVTQKKIEQIIV